MFKDLNNEIEMVLTNFQNDDAIAEQLLSMHSADQRVVDIANNILILKSELCDLLNVRLGRL